MKLSLPQLSTSDDILVVDDTVENLTFLKAILTKAGFLVRPATNGELALRSVQARPPDLILLDIRMPHMDGFQVCTQLKSSPATAEIPVIFISALQEVDEKIRAFQAGGVDYIVKPFQAEEVLTRVRTHLELSRVRRALVHSNEQLKQQVRERAQEAMQRQLALDAAKLGWWQYDPTTRSVQWDNRYQVICGVSGDSCPYEELLHLIIHPEDLPGLWDKVEAALNPIDPQPYVAEYRIHRANDGQLRWIEAHGSTTFEGEGLARRAVNFVGTVADITERKKAEETLKALTEFLEQQVAERTKQLLFERNNFRSIFENAYIGIARVSTEGHFLDINKEFCEITGYRRDELLSQPFTFRQITHPEDLPDDMVQVNRLLNGKAEKFTKEKRYIRKDGRIVWGNVSVHLIRDAGGKPLYFITTVLDITKRKQIEAELIEAKTAAEAANLAKSRFLATMSHEIRTPMNGILGMAQLLAEPRLDEGSRIEYARTVLASGQSLLTLLDDILDLSRVESGQLVFESIWFTPDRLLHDLRALYAEPARQKHLTLEATWIGKPQQGYRGDPYRLRQMLSNLVANALKFTRQGGIRIAARELDRERDVAQLEFSVQDTGIGIPPEKRAHLFQPFSQGDSSTTREYGGTGLGLAIVRHLAEGMDGKVGVDSQVGQGSRFWFRVHLSTSDEQIEESRLSPKETVPAVPCTLRGRVLVVEDNAINQQVIRAMLDKLELAHLEVGNGHLAVEAIERGEPIDLILMDIQMPVMDGYAATAAIRRLEAARLRSRLPIVALTADAFEEDRQHALAVGMDDFIAKPLDFRRLSVVLSRWLAPANETNASPTAVLPTGDVRFVVEGLALDAAVRPLEGNWELLRNMLNSFGRDYAEAVVTLDGYLTHERWEDAHRLVHTLKGLAASIGAEALQRASQALEKNLAQRKIDGLDEFKTELTRVLAAIASMPATKNVETHPLPAGQLHSLLAELHALLTRSIFVPPVMLEELSHGLSDPQDRLHYELLARQLDDFDYPAALRTLDTLAFSCGDKKCRNCMVAFRGETTA